jgi:hypothetical protein
MSGQQEVNATPMKPRPYWVDQPTTKVQTLEADGDREVVFLHTFAALNAGNQQLIIQREKDTKRVTEKMTKGRVRPRLPKESEANHLFYSALIQGGGFRPKSLPAAVVDKGLIPSEAVQLYKQNGDGQWHADFFPLTAEQMKNFSVEYMESAIEQWFKVKGESVASSNSLTDISFMFEQGGVIAVRLLIGDPENPAYRLKLLFRRPEQTRRSSFRDDFAYGIEHTKGEVGKLETVINLGQGISFCDEHFLGISTEPDTKPDGTIVHYSDVVFTDTRSLDERLAAGEAPRNITAVDPTPAATEEAVAEPEELAFQPYTEGLRLRFLQSFHPMYKVEAAATVISAFKRADRDN